MREELPRGYVIADGERRYDILETLGKGSSSFAYLARCHHDGMSTQCILKQFHGKDKEFFLSTVKMQNDIRQNNAFANQIPPIIHVLDTSQGVFVETVHLHGTTLDKQNNLTLLQCMEICLAVAKTTHLYHEAGFLCLDLKPENIFILQNGKDTITQMIEFIDFDGIHKSGTTFPISFTPSWAAPEQVFSSRVTTGTDIYAIGELVFYLLFGRHSKPEEHRGFSQYPFQEASSSFLPLLLQPSLQEAFTQLFRGTLRSSAANRRDMDAIIDILATIVDIVAKHSLCVTQGI